MNRNSKITVWILDALNAFKISDRTRNRAGNRWDERERNQQYIKRRDRENEDIALTVGSCALSLKQQKSKLNEQREYYEGVISDGSKHIAELENNSAEWERKALSNL